MRFLSLVPRDLFKMMLFLLLLLGMGIAQVWIWAFVRDQAEAWHQGSSRDGQLVLVKDQVRVLQQSLEGQASLLDQILAVAPPATQIPVLIDQLERAGDQVGVQVRVTSIEEGTGVLVPVTIHLDVTGGSDALFAYVQALEQRSEATRIQSLAIVPAGGVAGVTSGTYVLSLTMLFYVQPRI